MSDARRTADFAAITDSQRHTWALGDFNQVAAQLMPAAEALVAAADPRPDERVLDVACGSGNGALVAARRYCEVTGLDFVPTLLARARQRAAADGVVLTTVEGDAQALPFEAAGFDAVLSLFGVMFAPNQQLAADELARVVRPGGRIALASWTPEGAVGEFFRTLAKHVPPPPGVPPALRWGTEAGLHELLGHATKIVSLQRAVVTQHYRSARHMSEVFAQVFGPVVRALELLPEPARPRLHAELTAVFNDRNTARGDTLSFPCEYLQVVLERRA